MKTILTILCSFFTICVFSQFVGHTSKTYTDDSRNRDINCEIYYPATANGDDTPVANGPFPVIVFGHGFAMNFNDYDDLRASILPAGYVMVFVTTVGGLAPDHGQVGMDYAFVANQILLENTNTQSAFFGQLNNRLGMMGHSMGGGCSWLAAANNPVIDCVVGLAPAETTISAITAALNVTAPVLVFSGSSDNVTSPDENHIPIFENSQSECKILINITNGSHCGFADAQTLCDFGEFGFSGLSRANQQAAVYPVLLNWFDYYLKDQTSQYDALLNFADSNTNIDATVACSVSVDEKIVASDVMIYPNPVRNELIFSFDTHREMMTAYTVLDMPGRILCEGKVNSTTGIIQVEQLAPGAYFIRFYNNSESVVLPFTKN